MTSAVHMQQRKYHFCSLTYFSMLGDGTGVDLEDIQTSLFIGQFNVWRREEKNTCVVTRVLTVVIERTGEILRILRSSLPGRSRAGSRVSGLLVAMIILTLCSVSKPSIWFSNWQETNMTNYIDQFQYIHCAEMTEWLSPVHVQALGSEVVHNPVNRS